MKHDFVENGREKKEKEKRKQKGSIFMMKKLQWGGTLVVVVHFASTFMLSCCWGKGIPKIISGGS